MASLLVRSTHQCPWSNLGRTAMNGTVTSLKLAIHSSIFSGLTWIVTTRTSMAPLHPSDLSSRRLGSTGPANIRPVGTKTPRRGARSAEGVWRYGTFASSSGRITTLSCSFGSVLAPTKTAGVSPRLTAAWDTPAGKYK